ncbi:odorant receptor 131-2-like [Spea bombifrons]|uniref:odorant receptor 131-2-like n=1 Tax=Spea bombifrons TaxID=233779 RepID=UPI00234B0F44|nr:odorant receptor 131-2-like [Spea bombifrons]
MVNLTNFQNNVTRPASNLNTLNLKLVWITILTPTLICFLCFFYVIVIILKVFFTAPHVQENGRYVLFVHMLINDSMYLTLAMVLLVSSLYDVFFPISICYLLVTASSVSFKVTPLNLAVMSLERYVAICFPLRHAEFCTSRKSGIAIMIIWTVGLIPHIADIIILASVVKSGYFSHYVLCSRASFLNTPAQSFLRSFGHAMTFSMVGLVIVFTYVRIMVVALKIDSRKGSASKAGKTVMLHAVQLLLCVTAFAYPIIEMYLLQYTLLIPVINFCLFMFLPRFLSPLIYGIRDNVFREYIRRYFFCIPVRINSTPPTD